MPLLCGCGFQGPAEPVVKVTGLIGAPLSCLKRIPPLSELEGAQEWRYITNPKELEDA